MPLPPAARRLWDYYAPRYRALRLRTDLDEHRLAIACRLRALGLRELGRAERAGGDAQAIYAALKTLAQADATFARFGETPSDRARLRAAPDDDDHRSPLAAIWEAHQSAARPA